MALIHAEEKENLLDRLPTKSYAQGTLRHFWKAMVVAEEPPRLETQITKMMAQKRDVSENIFVFFPTALSLSHLRTCFYISESIRFVEGRSSLQFSRFNLIGPWCRGTSFGQNHKLGNTV